MADSENCGSATSLCPDFRLRPGLYDIYLCLRPKNWSVMLFEEKLESVFTDGHFRGSGILRDGYPYNITLFRGSHSIPSLRRVRW